MRQVKGVVLCLLLAVVALAGTGCGTTRTAERQREERGEKEERGSVEALAQVRGARLSADSVTVASMELSTRTGSRQESVLEVTREPVAAASASVSASVRSLAELPEGAGYSSRSGRAGVELARVGDEIVATGGCEGMEREVERLWCESVRESERADSLWSVLEAVRAQADEMSSALVLEERVRKEWEERREAEIEERSNGVWTVIKWLLTGFASGGLLMYIIGVKLWRF